MNLRAYIDGSSIGNPGEAGCGVVLETEKGKILKEIGQYIGQATNNVAEYSGLLACLEMVQQYSGCSLIVHSDSQLLVNQMKGIYRIRKPHLATLHAKAMDMIKKGQINFDIHYVPREKNRKADELARRAVLLQSGVSE